MKILIIGAGPSGLTAALAFSAKGQHCRIVERRTTPSELSRAVGILPPTIELLKEFGAADDILSEAMPLRKMKMSRRGKCLMALDNTVMTLDDKIIRGLPQDRTEEILRDLLKSRGVEVEYGLEVKQIGTTDESAAVEFSNGEKESYDWVVAADGKSSTTRTMLDIAYPGYDLPELWSIADVDVAGDFDPELIHLDAQGKHNTAIIILPIEKRRARIVASNEDALATFADFDYPLEIANVRRTGTFTISVRQAETYQKGRVLLVGDAAHCHSPVGGKGMNLGMDDAAAAVNAILDGRTDSFTEERHQIGYGVLQTTERGRRMAVSNNALSGLALTLATKVIQTFPVAHRKFMQIMSEL